MNILVVEDSATLRFAMDLYIREAGHKTIIAENGEKAVQIMETTEIDMIIMDVEMPGLNGFETTRLIREGLGEHWIPIIFVTGKSEEESLEEGIAVGGDDYLIKPVSKTILHAKIKAMARIAAMRTELGKVNEELKRLSQHDSLTQLYNRRTFEERAEEAWRLATRTKEPITILLFDIDFFKRYNDTYGHPAGDECIKEVSTALKSCFNRPGDVVARYGGEEFIVLLPNTGLEGAKHTSERIRSSIESLNIEHKESPEYKKVTVSIGGCTLQYTTGASIQHQIEIADRALYKSKHANRNCWHVDEFTNLHTVLLVDNSEQSVNEIREYLRGHCQLINLHSEDQFEDFQPSQDPELIIVAIDNDDNNNVLLYKKLCNHFHYNVVPLLLLSPLNKNELKEVGKELGANGSISKPVDANQLIAKISPHFKAH